MKKEELIIENEGENEEEIVVGDDESLNDMDTPDMSGHRTIVSHALKGEPAQMTPVFDTLVRDRISGKMDIKRAEIGANIFTPPSGD